MKQVTRNIDHIYVQDLLERVPRACISFAADDGPEAQSVAVLWRDGRYLIGIPVDTGRYPYPDQEVVLLIDEGLYFFDLRAIYIRGRVKPAETSAGAPPDCAWFEMTPLKIVAWDYGKLREVNDEH